MKLRLGFIRPSKNWAISRRRFPPIQKLRKAMHDNSNVVRVLVEIVVLAVLAAGVLDAIIVSNHGGRQLDGAMAALDALPEVRDAVGPDAIVLMDSGIRRGTDVLKAVVLGADAVLLGRPFVYGLAVGGQQGVEHVITTLKAEVDAALVLTGVITVNELDRSFVVSPGS